MAEPKFTIKSGKMEAHGVGWPGICAAALLVAFKWGLGAFLLWLIIVSAPDDAIQSIVKVSRSFF
ncbi:hypothetical protein [Rhizobium leguminosarum]|uniref:hypothetical protein n=1 Tax=Rhizobium leguminosarum TaxID=384 RepID=UPI00143F7108|nr:hypothetical protein [Rhizobium leguminosarum]NKL21187.1 hypothetical protein [Rhizobium leguminosarum bv. viciae]NKL56893.1 hypothetical protein [Rhizobium leguminosarum bv. viciae]